MTEDSHEPRRDTSPYRLRLAPRLADDAHKGDAGRVLCIVGSETMPGAAVLVARSAARAGAGLVCVGCLDDAPFRLVPAAVPEAVLVDLRPAFHADGAAAAAARAGLVARSPHARLVGPGLGDDPRTRALLELALASETGAPLAIDADGLNALDGRPERLTDCDAPVVITPHPGEAERLSGRAVPRDEDGRVELAVELARRGRCVVCLKARGTVVTDGERALVNRTGNPGLATGGSGDVLAGILVAYLALTGRAAEDWTPFDAAALAVHVHGLAGDLAAARLGRRAVIASDLVAYLPEAQRAIEEEGPPQGE